MILASRTLANIQKVKTDIHALHPRVQVEEIVLDLSNIHSVRHTAENILQIIGSNAAIDVLFNNAGINIGKKSITEQGVELQFSTNHLGPFLFTNLLLPSMLQDAAKNNKKKRIINTASEAHIVSPVRFSDINQEHGNEIPKDELPRQSLPKGMLKNDGTYDPAIAYAQSKTANVLFSVGLNTRYSSQGVKSFAVSPGSKFCLLSSRIAADEIDIMTNLARDLNKEGIQALLQGIGDKWKTLDQGASTLVVAGFDPGLDGR